MKGLSGKIKSLYKKLNKGFHRCINGTKGVISLFLAILMVPFATIAGLLINAARLDSAIAVFDEALCNASNSTLGTYDEFLRERFALLAISQKNGSYTVEDFISETFKFYMEEDFGALSNTYTKSEVSAKGVYPLADTDILLSEVLEAGKYNVPAKLLIDGLSIDDLIKSLTKNLNFASKIFDTISSKLKLLDKGMDLGVKIYNLSEALDDFKKARKNYNDSHEGFAKAVSEYNRKIDDIAEKQEAFDNAESALETEEDKIPNLLQEIESMENEVDANGNRVDNSEKINKYKEDHKDEMEDYNTAKETLETAERELNTAVENSGLENARHQVIEKKDNYVGAISALIGAIDVAGDAIGEFQESIKGLYSAGKELNKNIIKTICTEQTDAMDEQSKELATQRDAAAASGRTEEANAFQTQIDAINNDKTNIENANQIAEKADSAYEDAIGNVKDKFIEGDEYKDYKQEYKNEHDKLVGEFEETVSSYVVGEDTTTKLETVDLSHDYDTKYYKKVVNLLDFSEIKTLLESLISNITNASFFVVIKSIVNFIKAIYTMDIWFDADLKAKINEDNYSDIGGLPSKKSRDVYPLNSEFAVEDQKNSDYYKDLLGGYSNNPNVSGSVNTQKEIISNIMKAINDISDVCSGGWNIFNFFPNLFKLFSAIVDIVNNIKELIGNLLNIVFNAVEQKALLTGYIAYNIPNRTTYEGSALTGAKYSSSLPNEFSSKQGYAFYGAETEYIINGNFSERLNQTDMFNSVYLLRFVANILVVALNEEVSEIAEAAGAVTFGIGAVVVYVLYFLLEPFVDTFILVNSGDIPVVKRKVFLTPSGFPDFISNIMSLKLSPEQKEEIYKDSVKIVSTDKSKDKFPKSYKDAEKNYEAANKFEEAFTYDYTKTLIIVMMLFTSTDKLISRLADVIQMESSYAAAQKGLTFNLDKSYTYLRASGKFETNEFIKISNGIGLNSTERVVYRGY